MVYFRTKNPYLGKFWRALEWKMLMYFNAFWNILLTFRIFMTIWYIHLVHFIQVLVSYRYQEKSGNPARHVNDRVSNN
jgi:hypothetical protein